MKYASFPPRIVCFLGTCMFALVLSMPSPIQAAPVQPPVLLRNIQWTGTSWFGSPMVHNLGSGAKKIIGTFYAIYVWDGAG